MADINEILLICLLYAGVVSAALVLPKPESSKASERAPRKADLLDFDEKSRRS